MGSCTHKLFNCSNCSFGFQSTALNQGPNRYPKFGNATEKPYLCNVLRK